MHSLMLQPSGFLFTALALCVAPIHALDFSNSYWIWTNEANSAGNYPASTRAFRNDFCPPSGKTPAFANIIISTDNAYTLYINGNQVGSGDNWSQVGAYCVQLSSGCNTFALSATNYDGPGLNPAGVLAAIQVIYTDGSTSSIVTDGSWRSFPSVPAAFQQIGYDDSAWPHARVEGSYGVSPWNILAMPPSPSSTLLHLTDANWIWTSEVDNDSGGYESAPVGYRAFRKDIVLPPGITASSAFITISVDNEYDLYVQGNLVGSGSAWQEANIYNVQFPSPLSQITIAVKATNTNLEAGIICTVQLTLTNNGCGPYASVITDDTWRWINSVPSGFQAPGFDDSNWGWAVVQSSYGDGIWGDIPVESPGGTPGGPGGPGGHA
ncbi:hypothetical protein CVT26_015622 [Gymnopilus dilepis]|uniref:Uncharacterized protein n=1 Tax=Gymnopilus dilepis TaxID=231916 RepID=A0A409YDE9_9AGAR|nr:hypothetical protein CVT26_015622 [Gymnopilus dilepis]